MTLSDEQIQDLLRVGNPTDEECRLIRMGWDAAMRERIVHVLWAYEVVSSEPTNKQNRRPSHDIPTTIAKAGRLDAQPHLPLQLRRRMADRPPGYSVKTQTDKMPFVWLRHRKPPSKASAPGDEGDCRLGSNFAPGGLSGCANKGGQRRRPSMTEHDLMTTIAEIITDMRRIEHNRNDPCGTAKQRRSDLPEKILSDAAQRPRCARSWNRNQLCASRAESDAEANP